MAISLTGAEAAASASTSAARLEWPAAGADRIVALDGLRGALTLMVLVAHFIGEAPSGFRALALGWLAVTAFFVLSGYLVGGIILDRRGRSRFFSAFLMQRVCRTLPVYVVTVLAAFAVIGTWAGATWVEDEGSLPLWSYLSFSQNLLMAADGTPGTRMLQPTWTLAVEEQFYLLGAVLLVLAPRRHLLKGLVAAAILTVIYRSAVIATAPSSTLAVNILLPGVADAFVCGILAALAIRSRGVDWVRYDLALRIAPVLLLMSAIALKVIDGRSGHLFAVFGPLLVSLAAASFILALVRGAEEARRFTSPVLCFFGRASYSIYLTHMPVLVLMHGLIVGGAPDLATPGQWLVTLAAIPASLLIGWTCCRLIEEPSVAYGRSFGWGEVREETMTVPPERRVRGPLNRPL